jgi:hypothetical protein
VFCILPEQTREYPHAQQQATSNKQQATSNKQQATSNKQQATSNKQQATSNIRVVKRCICDDLLGVFRFFA